MKNSGEKAKTTRHKGTIGTKQEKKKPFLRLRSPSLE